MGASSSVEHKSTSQKTRTTKGASSVDQPQQNGTLAIQSPSTTASTPSSPNRDPSLLRSRSRSSDAGLPALASATEATADTGNNDVDSDRETIGFSLAQLADYYNLSGSPPEGNDDNQSPDAAAERTCQSRDPDNVTTTDIVSEKPCIAEVDAETASIPSNKTPPPLQVCGVKPPTVEQPAPNAETVDESAKCPGHEAAGSAVKSGSSSSSINGESKQRPSSGAGASVRPKLQETRSRPSSEAITDIAQAKKLSHRAVVSHADKSRNATGDSKVTQRLPTSSETTATSPQNGTASKEPPERCSSAKSVKGFRKLSTGRPNSGKKPAPAKSSDHQTRRQSQANSTKKTEHQRSENTPAAATKDSKKVPAQQNETKYVNSSRENPDSAQPEMKVVVRNKPTDGNTAAASNDNKKPTSTKGSEKVSTKHQSTTSAVNVRASENHDYDDDEEDDWDWENLITSLRDPDDIRHRKVEVRRGSNWKTAKPKKAEKAAGDKPEEEEEEEDKDGENKVKN